MTKYLFLFLVAGSAADARQKSEVLELGSGEIVGYQRKPKIFMEFETHSPTMDSIIFRRDDFDPQQKQEVRRRFKIVPPEGGR